MKNKTATFNPTEFPSGTYVKTAAGDYLVQNQSRLRIKTKAVRQSWSFPHVLNTTEDSLKDYPIVGTLGFRAGTVIYSMEDGLYYLIEKNAKRQIVNPQWFEFLKMNRFDAVVASQDDAKLHKTGEVLN